MSISHVSGIPFGASGNSSFNVKISGQKAQAEDGVEKNAPAEQSENLPSNTTEPYKKGDTLSVSLPALLHSCVPDYSQTTAGALQEALLGAYEKKDSSLISNLFADPTKEQSRYLQSQLDSLKMQNEFATEMQGVLVNSIYSLRAGQPLETVARQIESKLDHVVSKKISEDAKEELDKAEEETEEKNEEKAESTEESSTDSAQATVQEAIDKMAEATKEKNNQGESGSGEQQSGENTSVQGAAPGEKAPAPADGTIAAQQEAVSENAASAQPNSASGTSGASGSTGATATAGTHQGEASGTAESGSAVPSIDIFV